MSSVPRPLIALLAATLVFFALWMTALKPSGGSSSGSSGSQGLGQYQTDLAKAHQAVTTSNNSNAAAAGDAPTAAAANAKQTGATTTAPAKPATTSTTTPAKPATTSHTTKATSTTSQLSSAAQHRLDVVSRALVANKVIALLFYNPTATDDRAVKQELATVPTDRGRVVKLAVPVSELARYTVVTTQVPVQVSPTLVLIDPRHQAETIVGFADRFEIARRVQQALSAR